MDKYIFKKVVSRKRQWVTETDDDTKNLNTTRGRYITKKEVYSSRKDPDIRFYSKESIFSSVIV